MAWSPEQRRAYDREYYRKKRRKTASDLVRLKTAPFTFRLPVTLLARLQQLCIEANRLGLERWKTTSDVMKAMIERGLFDYASTREAEELGPLPTYLPVLRMQQYQQDEQRDRMEAQSMLAMTKQNIKARRDAGADEEALVAQFDFALTTAKEMQDTFWSRWLIEQLYEEWPDYAKRHEKGDAPFVTLSTKRPPYRIRRHSGS